MYVFTAADELPEDLDSRMDVWADARAELLMSTRATFMPYAWQRLANARPIPEAAPVMRAVVMGLKMRWGGMLAVGVGDGEERKRGEGGRGGVYGTRSRVLPANSEKGRLVKVNGENEIEECRGNEAFRCNTIEGGRGE